MTHRRTTAQAKGYKQVSDWQNKLRPFDAKVARTAQRRREAERREREERDAVAKERAGGSGVDAEGALVSGFEMVLLLVLLPLLALTGALIGERQGWIGYQGQVSGWIGYQGQVSGWIGYQGQHTTISSSHHPTSLSHTHTYTRPYPPLHLFITLFSEVR